MQAMRARRDIPLAMHFGGITWRLGDDRSDGQASPDVVRMVTARRGARVRPRTIGDLTTRVGQALGRPIRSVAKLVVAMNGLDPGAPPPRRPTWAHGGWD